MFDIKEKLNEKNFELISEFEFGSLQICEADYFNDEKIIGKYLFIDFSSNKFEDFYPTDCYAGFEK